MKTAALRNLTEPPRVPISTCRQPATRRGSIFFAVHYQLPACLRRRSFLARCSLPSCLPVRLDQSRHVVQAPLLLVALRLPRLRGTQRAK